VPRRRSPTASGSSPTSSSLRCGRAAALLAKQTATLDQLSDGRLVLGMSPGGREDDYAVSGLDFAARGRTFDRQLEELERLWKGEGGVGPAPARGERPGLLVGGAIDRAFRRAARFADGWTAGGAGPDQFRAAREKLHEAWRAEGRDGEPRTMALFYFSLGDRAREAAQEGLGDYYAWLGDYAQSIVDSAAMDADTVRQYVAAFEDAGADEVIAFPASADPAQVELLAEAVL
jgi:alkanesulfonate monooxygenase SsuD/methylene tetrahydromethanopterin reductase-like flavin-dependent oxidoreductase (luciferase family)